MSPRRLGLYTSRIASPEPLCTGACLARRCGARLDSTSPSDDRLNANREKIGTRSGDKITRFCRTKEFKLRRDISHMLHTGGLPGQVEQKKGCELSMAGKNWHFEHCAGFIRERVKFRLDVFSWLLFSDFIRDKDFPIRFVCKSVGNRPHSARNDE